MNSLSSPVSPSPARPRPWPDAARRAAFGKIVANEARLTWRRPVGLIGGVGIPVLLLVIFGELPAFRAHPASYGGLTVFEAYVPVLIVFGVAMLALLGLPLPLVSYRELGVLRRLSTTPVPPSWVLAAQAVIQACVAVGQVVVDAWWRSPPSARPHRRAPPASRSRSRSSSPGSSPSAC